MLAIEGEGPVRPRAQDHLQLLLEDVHPLARRREGEPVGLVLALVPTGAEPELHPAVRDVVGGDDRLGQHRRVAEGRGRDERPQAQRRRHGAERRERRPGVERAALGVIAPELQVVVGAKERRDAVLLARTRQRDPLRPRTRPPGPRSSGTGPCRWTLRRGPVGRRFGAPRALSLVAGGSCRRTRPQTPQAPSEGRVPRHPLEHRPCPAGHHRPRRGPPASTASQPQLLRRFGAPALSAGVSRHRGLPPRWRANGALQEHSCRPEGAAAPFRRKRGAQPRCRPDQTGVSSSHVFKGPGTHLLCVRRGSCDPRGLRPPRRGSGCGGLCRDARVHSGLHLRVAPQRRRCSSRCRPGRPRRVVRGLVLERRADSLLHRGRRGSRRARTPLPSRRVAALRFAVCAWVSTARPSAGHLVASGRLMRRWGSPRCSPGEVVLRRFADDPCGRIASTDEVRCRWRWRRGARSVPLARSRGARGRRPGT